MNNAFRASLLALSIGLLAAASAHAGTQTASFKVKVKVVNDCTISASDLSFGTVGLLNAAVDGASNVAIVCNNNAAYNVGLDGGAVNSSVAARQMAGAVVPTARIDYQLYSDSGRTQIWGDTVGTDTVSGVGNAGTQNLAVYGQIPAQSTPDADDYEDTLTATVTF